MSMSKPTHDARCYPRNRPNAACPACAWEAAVEATLQLVADEAGEHWYQVTLLKRLRALREKVLND